MSNGNLPTQKEVQKKFDAAAAACVPTYNWLPPKWPEVKDSLVLPDNSQDTAGFLPLNKAPTARKFVSDSDTITPESHPGDEPDPASKAWPHPFSDFTHVDPTQFADEDYQRLRKGNSRLGAFKSLTRVVGPESTGMRRLALVYEWIVYRATVLLNDINRSLDDKELASPGAQPGQSQEDKYTAARDNYIALLKDLDDHEPEFKLAEIEKGRGKIPVVPGKRGYGRTIKWVHIDPIIVNGRIQEARIIAHWNPHSSSDGVPILH